MKIIDDWRLGLAIIVVMLLLTWASVSLGDTMLIYTCPTASAEGKRADTFAACPAWSWNRPNTGLIASNGTANGAWTATLTWRKPENVQGTWATSVCLSNIAPGTRSSCASEVWRAKSVVFPTTPPPTTVNCVVSAWGEWTPTGEWSSCVDNIQSRTEQRTRTVVTPPANGGTACPVLIETRTVTQACTPPPTILPPSAPYNVAFFTNYDKCQLHALVYGHLPNAIEAQKLGSTEIVRSDPSLNVGHVTCEQLGIEAGQATWVRVRACNTGGCGGWSGYWPAVRFTQLSEDPQQQDTVRVEVHILKNRTDSFTTQCPSP